MSTLPTNTIYSFIHNITVHSHVITYRTARSYTDAIGYIKVYAKFPSATVTIES